jgi:predicted dehydrogenase
MATDQVRLGIIGLGAEGGMYATFLSEGKVPNMTIGAIADIDESKRAAAEKLGVPFYTDYQELINSGDVDAVVTTVPHYLHPRWASTRSSTASTPSWRSRSASTPSRPAS